MNHFKETDLEYNYSRWNVENGVQHILPPLSLDKDLVMIKIKDGNFTKVDFRIIEFNGLLLFQELLSDRKYGFDISDVNLDKIYFRVQNDQGVIWTRLLIESIDDLMHYYR